MSEQIHQENEIINRVLFVDDEPNILSSLRRGLAREKYVKFFALNAEEALYIMQEHDIHVIVSDMRMPGMSGLDLLKLVSEKYPHIVKIVLSGYTQLPQVLATVNQVDIYKFVPKPWNMEEEFIPLIRGAVNFYNMQNEYRQFRTTLEKQNQFYQKLIRQNEDKYGALKSDFERFNQYHLDLGLKWAEFLKHPDNAQLSPADIASKMAAYEGMSKLFTSCFPLESSSFSSDKLKTDLSALLLALQPKQEEEHVIYVGKPPVSKEPEPSFPIKTDGSNHYYSGNYKLFLAIQRMILVRLFATNNPNVLSVSQVYSPSTSTLVIQYETDVSHLIADKWDFQLNLFTIKYATQMLPGKIDIQKNDNQVKVTFAFHCTLK